MHLFVLMIFEVNMQFIELEIKHSGRHHTLLELNQNDKVGDGIRDHACQCGPEQTCMVLMN